MTLRSFKHENRKVSIEVFKTYVYTANNTIFGIGRARAIVIGTSVAVDTPITGPAIVCTSHTPEGNKMVFMSFFKKKGLQWALNVFLDVKLWNLQY